MAEENCIFCQLASGKVPSKKVFESSHFTGILDIYPANPGHILVIPKDHVLLFNQLSKEQVEELGIVSKQLSNSVFKAFKPDGVNVFIANGPAAGQKAPHFIMHVIPRFNGDGLGFATSGKDFPKSEIDAAYLKIKAVAENYFPGQNFDEEPVKKPQPAPSKEPLRIEVERKPEPIPQKPKEEMFITSATAKRFHREKCAFAQNIQEDRRIYGTAEQMIKSGREPCTCVSGEAIPLEKHEPKPEDKKEEIDLDKIATMLMGKR